MDFIKEITIKNFRSIKSLKFSPTHLNILVGKNDQGKSNILKALNLFFHNQTDIGKSFRFEDDYCYNAPSGRGRRIEIKVELLIHPPRNRFRNPTPVIWTRVWKRDGSINETRKHPDGSELPERNNVSQWLNKMIYRYVPAVKGQEYFSTLMGELHDVLNTIHADTLAAQGEGFISGIQNITQEITHDLDIQLGIPNTIQVPSDFKALFSNLDFGTKKNGNTYHLKQRGDGVKARHIPVILKYMSVQEKETSIPGYVKPDTVWGFEEPENNLEFKYAFDVAEKIREYSKDIQIYITTHSPAFYALDKEEGDGDGVSIFYISLNEQDSTDLKKVSHDLTDKIHEDMGMLPIITPYLEKIYEGEKKLLAAVETIRQLERDFTCFVLTEDEDHDALEKLLEFNGFNMDDTKIVSYEGSGSIHASIVLGKFIKSNHENSDIVVHRDRDYLNDAEINQLRDKVTGAGFFFFTTEGTDIESCFIVSEHICELYNEVNSELVDQLIDEATEESKEDSLRRLINCSMRNHRPQDVHGFIKELEQAYEQNKERYRYGKKVLGLLKSKIQRRIRRNPNLFQESEHIKLEDLLMISDLIW